MHRAHVVRPPGGVTLRKRLRVELDAPVDDGLARLAQAVADRHPGALSVVHYGATLRSGDLSDQLIDLYLIVEDYARAYRSRALATANRLVPPNVFPITSGKLSAKYAVLDCADLIALTGCHARTVSVWARFCQPVRLVWRRDEAAVDLVVDATRRSVLTLLSTAAPLADGGQPLESWRTGLRLTYGAELRAERGGRVDTVLDADPDRYRALALSGAAELGWPIENGVVARRWSDAERAAERRRWASRRWRGKAVTLLRLAKASATYGGGIEYLASKIERHSGHPVRLRPWQRRLPLLGALWLLPSLIRSGAVR